jgi:hypothetical protein
MSAHRLRFTRAAHDLGGAAAAGGGEYNLGAPHMLLWRAAIRDDRLKPTATFSRDDHNNSCSNDERLNGFGRLGIV